MGKDLSSGAWPERAEELLEKLKDGSLSTEERMELDQFEQAERFMRLVKARIQAGKARRPGASGYQPPSAIGFRHAHAGDASTA